MSSDLLGVHAGRPPVTNADGVRIYVAVHDTYYLRTYRAWRRKLALVHPDRHPTTQEWHAARFRTVHAAYQAWLAAEDVWYRELGLDPPDDAGARRRGPRGPLARVTAEAIIQAWTDLPIERRTLTALAGVFGQRLPTFRVTLLRRGLSWAVLRALTGEVCRACQQRPVSITSRAGCCSRACAIRLRREGASHASRPESHPKSLSI